MHRHIWLNVNETGQRGRGRWLHTALAAAMLTAAGCAPQDPFDEPEQGSSEAAVARQPQREFLSEAQAARARHYWSREALEPYGVLPADAERSGAQ